MLSNHLILCLHLFLLPSIFPSIRVFSKDSALLFRWPRYRSFNFTIILPMSIQGWFPLGLTSLISLLSKGLSRVLSRTTIWKHQFLRPQVSSWSNSPFVHDYWKNHSCDNMDLCWQSDVSAFNTLSKLVIVSLPRSKRLLISWLQSVCSDFGAQENKICQCFHFSPFYLPWSDGTGCHDLNFLNAEF